MTIISVVNIDAYGQIGTRVYASLSDAPTARVGAIIAVDNGSVGDWYIGKSVAGTAAWIKISDTANAPGDLPFIMRNPPADPDGFPIANVIAASDNAATPLWINHSAAATAIESAKISRQSVGRMLELIQYTQSVAAPNATGINAAFSAYPTGYDYVRNGAFSVNEQAIVDTRGRLIVNDALLSVTGDPNASPISATGADLGNLIVTIDDAGNRYLWLGVRDGFAGSYQWKQVYPAASVPALFNSPAATGLSYGSSPTIVQSGDGSPATPYHLTFGIPAGQPGVPALFNSPAATGLSYGSSPTIVQSGDGSPATPYHLTFGIPAGQPGMTQYPPLPLPNEPSVTFDLLVPGFGVELPWLLPHDYAIAITSDESKNLWRCESLAGTFVCGASGSAARDVGGFAIGAMSLKSAIVGTNGLIGTDSAPTRALDGFSSTSDRTSVFLNMNNDTATGQLGLIVASITVTPPTYWSKVFDFSLGNDLFVPESAFGVTLGSYASGLGWNSVNLLSYRQTASLAFRILDIPFNLTIESASMEFNAATTGSPGTWCTIDTAAGTNTSGALLLPLGAVTTSGSQIRNSVAPIAVIGGLGNQYLNIGISTNYVPLPHLIKKLTLTGTGINPFL